MGELNFDNLEITGYTKITRADVLKAIEDTFEEAERFENDLNSLERQINKLVEAFNECDYDVKITVSIDIEEK